MKIFKTIILLILIGSTQNICAQITGLDSLINRALDVSSKLKMLDAKHAMAKSRVNINSNLPNPMLSLGVMNLPTNSFSFRQEPMTGKIIGFSQEFPFPGKLSTKEDILQKDAKIIEQEIYDEKNEIIKVVSENYYDLIFVRKTIKISEKSKNLLENISEIIKSNYIVSKASLQNLLASQLELTKITGKIIELRSRENSIEGYLNSIMLFPADDNIYTAELPEIPFNNFSVSNLDSLAKLNRPMLKGISTAERKAQLQEELAGYNYYPDFKLSVQYSQRDEIANANTPLDDMVSFMVGISIPINYGGKISSSVAEAEAMQNLYEQKYNSTLQILQGKFSSSISKLNSLKKRIMLLENTLFPQAENVFTTTLSAYKIGAVDFINVIDAQNKLFEIQTDIFQLKTNYLKEIIQLEFLTGTNLMNLK